ncbi:nucleoside diphosphate kinase [Cystoisospora suis]|uniref:Nucleoside diphosphate kinase n=1 Tax=Cystoisospora suis TaxID=483139 RepID=A0A2C6KPV7_9APIC|nr:nucleoside diphosphate kinase [Cystoisospora suis]
MASYDNTLVFRVTWYDRQADLTKDLILSYHRADNSVELYDPKLRRLFLKRTPAAVPLEDQLYVGNTVVVVSRQLKIVDYADERTHSALAPRLQKAVVVLKPHAHEHMGNVLQRLLDDGLTLSVIQMVELAPHQANAFLDLLEDNSSSEHDKNSDTRQQVVQSLSNGRCIVMAILGNEASSRLGYIVGPADPAEAKLQAPESLRAAYGTSTTNNAILWKELNDSQLLLVRKFLSGATLSPPELGTDCSCCVIKPSSLHDAGKIIKQIRDSGFRITALQSFHLSRNAAEEFYEVYKTVLHELPQMIDELAQGICIAMQVEHKDKQSVPRLRELAGPYDSEMARFVRPHSLRALFGSDRVRNAIHCTDLEDDAVLEVQYFFSVLANTVN